MGRARLRQHILDEDEPHLDLRNFFPCPKPAYGTVQRGSLVPVPDVLQYSDQLDEIDLLTGKIHALSEALECKGFYPAGGAELAEAIQSAVQTNTPGRLLIPIANWASFGGTKDVIIWMPIEQIATTITALVAMRKQVIDDIYQIMGLSDIMRGDTDPNETLGAQQIKTQNGSARVRDKQQELARMAKDLVEITSEIITEKFQPETIIDMSQTTLPTQRMQQQQVMQIQQQLMQMQQQMMQMQQQQAQQPPPQQPPGGQPPPPDGDPDGGADRPDPAADADGHGRRSTRSSSSPTSSRCCNSSATTAPKAFTLDIETDSTIVADEQAEKPPRAPSSCRCWAACCRNCTGQMISTAPETINVCGEILKILDRRIPGRPHARRIDRRASSSFAEAEGRAAEGRRPGDGAGQDCAADRADEDYLRPREGHGRPPGRRWLRCRARTRWARRRTRPMRSRRWPEVQGRQQEHSAKIYEMNLDAQNEQQKHNFEMQQAAMKARMDMQKHELAQQTAARRASQMDQQLADRRAQTQFKPPGGLV